MGPEQKLLDRVKGDVEKLQAENPDGRFHGSRNGFGIGTRSAHLARAAGFKCRGWRAERGLTEAQLRQLVAGHTEGRNRFSGEPRVNVLN